MCGIWGVIDSETINKKQVKSWLDLFNSIKSRGPDKSTITHFGNIIYGFHRLAIHDLTVLGDQPFIFVKEGITYLLEANGEIYNYKELAEKHDLISSLKSDSDCEVIMHLYWKLGSIQAVCKELRGEFAFALTQINLDSSTQTYLCRDPIGVRPLFYSCVTVPSYTVYSSNPVQVLNKRIMFGSLLSGVLDPEASNPEVFPPGKILTIVSNSNYLQTNFTTYYTYEYLSKSNITNPSLYWEITSRLINAVKVRLDSDRPIGALLSGGLDSSLVCAIASKILGINNLKTFSIGMKKGTDLEYAQMVATHLGCAHTEVYFTPEQGLEAIDKVIDTTETWDITTIRASVGQLLLGQYISSNTDIKVILNGDGADEVEMGYLYFYLAPDAESAQKESIKLVKQIHRYDGLRVDRCISVHGLEARLPFLDQDFVDYYMQIDPDLKLPTETNMEKQLIRDAFATLYPGLLPNQVLYRKKEAFSDGVSSKEKSWFEMITEWIDSKVMDKEFVLRDMNHYGMCKSKESYYYRKRFNEKFNRCALQSNEVIPGYWLPNWIETNGEPSARVLQVYK
jgi:asparagine synthase (glutamine-hydrolysing)